MRSNQIMYNIYSILLSVSSITICLSNTMKYLECQNDHQKKINKNSERTIHDLDTEYNGCTAQIHNDGFYL